MLIHNESGRVDASQGEFVVSQVLGSNAVVFKAECCSVRFLDPVFR